ncbi:unnamed protein product [Amoebophrya sp. A120]|nr:unnamed protein product [Amoebophrya sp. A120]|eukprot:GSA120T00000696001.1
MEIANLPDREERIAARRRRAEAKLKREKEELDDTGADLLEEQDQGLGKQMVSEATAFLERLQYDTTNDLTDIRVRFDNEENERRIIEENARLDRYEALQIEAVSSGRKNAAVELKWADLLYIDIPQELHDQLLLQKEACLNILEGKDRRIREFLTELKNKDEEYQKMLKRQAHDVNLLIKKMRAQYVGLQEKYDEQLVEIENAFAQERTDLMKRNREDIENLFEKRRQMEEAEFMDQRVDREKRFKKKIDDLREQNDDEYNHSRIALEKSIQELEVHLEKMMATYQLNKEKLDYNLQVLIERNKEHSAIQSSYKNRLNRLRETLNTLLTRYNKLDAKYKTENQELTEEYKRLTKQFKDLQDKHAHFEKADEIKFREVWAMNEGEAKQVIGKILECDKLIHEQQLSLPWSSPQENLLNEQFETGTSTEAGTQTGTKSLSKNMSSAGGGGGGEGKKGVEFFAKRTKKVLDLIKDECSYLLDVKIKDEMALAPDAAQRDVIQVNAILKYIGVESQEDLDLLTSMFYQGQDDDDETLYVDADDVLRILREFLAEKENLRMADLSGGASKKAGEDAQESKNLRRKQEKKFWDRMALCLPETTVRVWKALQKQMGRYLKLLHFRSQLVDDAVDLQKQNEELKQLLDQYLGSKVNEELQIPPTHVIRVVTGGAGAPPA